MMFFSPSPVLAEDNEEDGILSLPPGSVPGLDIVGIIHASGIGTAPDTPLDPYFVTIPKHELNLTIPGQSERRVCGEEQIGIGEHIECEYQEKYVLTSACDSMIKTLRLIPIFGNKTADHLEETALMIDEAIQNLLENPPEKLPEDYKNVVGEASRNTPMQDLLNCKGTINSVASHLQAGDISLNIELGVSIPLCVHSGIQEPLGLCLGPIENTSAIQHVIENSTIPIVTNSCSFDNLTMNCGTVNETGDEIDPFEHWNDLVGELEAMLQIEIRLTEHDQTLPGTTDGWLHASTGEHECGHGGIPPNDDGDMFGQWWIYASAEFEEGVLPFGLEEHINPLFKEVFRAVNENLTWASNTWNGTMDLIVETINEQWGHHTGPDGLGWNTNREGDIGGTECRTKKGPHTDHKVPRPTHPDLP